MNRIITLCKLIDLNTNSEKAQDFLNECLNKTHELGLNAPEIQTTSTKAVLVFTLDSDILKAKEKKIREFFGLKRLPDF